MNLLRKNIGLLFFLVLFSSLTFGQTTEDIKKEADALFKKEQFVEATPLYLQLLNVEPRSHELNFKYGTCLIYSAQDKAESIRFLNFSVKSQSIDPLAHYFLGKAYHLNYQFSNAISSYNKFKEVGSQTDQKKYNIDANIEACKNGKQLLSNITDMIVMNKTEVKEQDFYELYKLNNIGGSLLITDQFQTKMDKKLNHRPIIYFPKNSPYIFYSSYGESGETGLDIYVKKKLPNGKWTDAVKVVGDVNTDLDEDYPFLSLDGKYLYYSSKGHNSMGGYDVFRSKVIVEGSSFAKPENMDFAVSSPNDDILYIVDSLDRTAFFSSARESQDGKLYVYEVRVEKIPMQLAVLKGDFTNELDPGNKNIKIDVINFTTGAKVGTFNSTPKNGQILLTLPKSGKYTFEMTVQGSPITHRAEVSVPYIKEFRPLKIDISHQLNNGQEVIVLKTLFDDKFDDPTAIMADVYQRISKLDPNANKYNLDSLNNLRNADNVFAEAGIDKYSTVEDISEILEKASMNGETQKKSLEQHSFVAHNIAERKQAEAKSKLKEADEMIKKGLAETDPAAKQNTLTAAYKLTKEAESLNKEAEVLVDLGTVIEAKIREKDAELVSVNSALLGVKAIDQNDGTALNNFVEKNTAVLAAANKSEVNTSVLEKIQNEGNTKKQELNQITEKLDDLTSRQKTIESNIAEANNQLDNTKKKKEIEAINSTIESAKSELDLITNEITKYEGKKERFNETEQNAIALVAAVEELQDERNLTEENTKAVSNAQKLKIKYSVDETDFVSSLQEATKVFEENNISGESINLAGLNESTVQPVTYNSLTQVNNRIEEVIAQLDKEADPQKKTKLENELTKLNDLKEDFVEDEKLASVKTVSKTDLVNDYNKRQTEIVAIKDIAKQKEAQFKLNSEIKEAAQKQVNSLTKKEQQTEVIKTEIAQLQKIIEESNNEIKEYEDWKVAVENQNNFADFTYKDALDNVSENYESRIEEIYNSNDSDKEKSAQIKALNDATLANAKERLQEADATVKASPENALAIKEKRQYSRLVEELETKGSIPLVDPVQTPTVVSNKGNLTENDLIPDYSEKINRINNSAINEIDKEKATLNINNELLAKVNSEIQAINNNSELAKSKDNKKILAELQKMQRELTEEIASSEAIISKKIEENPSLDNSIESIASNYTSESYRINELKSDGEKISAIEALNEKAIIEIDKKIKQTKIANAANPREELQYEIGELETLKKELLVNKSKDYYGVVSLDSDEKLSELKGNASIEDIEPEYQLKMESILEDAISLKDLERKKIELNEEALAKTNREIRRIENGINEFPENKKQLTKRKESLSEIKLILEDKIFESKAIVGEDPGIFNIVVDVEDANPAYSEKVSEIRSLPIAERESAVKELNSETVELIERKISIIEEDLRKNGRDNKKVLLLQKYSQLVAEIEANPQLPAKGSVSSNQLANSSNNKGETEFPVIYKSIEITEALPEYQSELDSISSLVKSVVEKERDKIELYKKSISTLKLQAKELETYSRIESPNKQYAEEKRKNIEEIIEVLENEVLISEQKITDIDSPQSFAGILDIMPDYDTRKEKIEYESTSTVEKLKNTNELNKVLLFEIESKVTELESLQKEDISETRAENIIKLNEFASAINTEIENTGKILKASEQDADIAAINENKFEPLNPDHFKDDLETNQLNLIKKDVKLIKTFEKDIARLERKKARLKGNDAEKVQKEIDKTIAKQSTLHNRLITDLEGVVDEKLWVELTSSKENSIKIKGANMHSDEIRNAEEGMIIAEAKIEKAKAYRKDAAQIKNQVVANKILLKAAQLEYEAQQLLETSNTTLTTAAIVSELASSEAVVLSVDQSEENRVSTDLFNLATDIERRAFAAELRAGQLLDSSLTVKKKYRAAIVLEAENLKAEQERLLDKADNLRERAEEIKEQESEIIAVIPSTSNRDVPKAETAQVLKTNTYQNYFELIETANKKIDSAKAIQQKIEELKLKASKIIRQAIVLDEDATMEDHQSNPQVIQIMTEIDKLTMTQKELRNDALTNFELAQEVLDNGNESKNLKESMILMAQRGVTPNTEVVLTQEDLASQEATTIPEPNISNQSDSQTVVQQVDVQDLTPAENSQAVITEASSDYLPPSKLNGQLFRITDKAVYSKDNPIPVNAKQPEGLVYKVQVGAFRNPLPPDSFDKFAPISGQVLPSGVTRYMVGYFTNFLPADNAKAEIHDIGGYSDAFVVAYFNGERININKAKEMEENGVIPGNINDQPATVNTTTNATQNNIEPTAVADNNQLQITNNNNNQSPVVSNTANDKISEVDSENFIVKPVTSVDKEKTNYYTSVENAAPASQVEIIEGLFYTVQIGVYSNPVPSKELFDVSPLNSQLTKSGKIRYSTGIYTTIEDAIQRKNQLVEIGIVDAFVTAYFNGERISITASNELIATKGLSVFTKGKTISETEGVPASRYNKENIYYRILLGKYENTVPSNVANYLFNDDNIFFETEIDADNIIYLYTQKFFTLDEVNKRLVEINELGFEDMEILSYYNIQVIPFEEAQKIINNEPIEELTEYDVPKGTSADKLFYEAEAIYYRVNIKVSSEEDYNNLKTKLNDLGDNNFEVETMEDGDLIIHSDNIGTFEEAKAVLARINQINVKGAEVAAYHKYVQISTDKALEIKGK